MQTNLSHNSCYIAVAELCKYAAPCAMLPEVGALCQILCHTVVGSEAEGPTYMDMVNKSELRVT